MDHQCSSWSCDKGESSWNPCVWLWERDSYIHVQVVYLNQTIPHWPTTKSSNWESGFIQRFHAKVEITDYDSKLKTITNSPERLRSVYSNMASLFNLFSRRHPNQHSLWARTTNKQAPEKMARLITCIPQYWTICAFDKTPSTHQFVGEGV